MATGSFHTFDTYLHTKDTMGQSPLPPLKVQGPPVSEEDSIKLARIERAAHIVSLLSEDVEVTAFVIKSLLDTQDPKKVQGLLKTGFEMKIASMQQDHADLQGRLTKEVDDGKMQQTEMLIRIKNSDGKIRSMQWFHANLG